MILELYDHIGSTRHDDDLTLADSPIPHIGEWLYFHHEAGDWRKGKIYRVVSVDYTI